MPDVEENPNCNEPVSASCCCVAKNYEVTLSGITDGACGPCGGFNDTWVLSVVEPHCILQNNWYADPWQSNVCYETGATAYQGRMILSLTWGIDENNHCRAELIIGAVQPVSASWRYETFPYAYYLGSRPDAECGNILLTRVDESEEELCNGFPSTLMVTEL